MTRFMTNTIAAVAAVLIATASFTAVLAVPPQPVAASAAFVLA